MAAAMNLICCRFCSNILRNPVIIPCGHSFCLQCCEDSWDQKDRPNCEYKCPECSCVFPSKPQLTRNSTLEQLVRHTQNYENGSKKRKQQDLGASLQDPKRKKDTGTPGDMCGRQRGPLDKYCFTKEHQGHRTMNVECERKKKLEDLKNMQEKLKEILQQQEKTQNDTKKMFEQIQEEASQTKDFCESVVVKVIDSLQNHCLSVEKLIDAHEAAALAKVQQTLKDLDAKMEENKKRTAELDSLGQTESDAHFLQEWASLQLLCKDCLFSSRDVLEDPLCPFELTKRDVEHLGNQLEEFCDKEFASICQAAVSKEQEESAGETEEKDTQPDSEGSMSLPHVNNTMTQQNVEPETRAQFLQYACELTLNPHTAHDDLVVSEGDKKVKVRPQVFKSPSVRYPERFMRRRQVLCREGLQAERCYYEVEVEGDKLEIGLAYKSIDRKSNDKRSAFGGNAVSWSLDRSKCYSVSHNNEGVQLTTSPGHARIGVYLKFKEGTLAFYEVYGDSMKFLYRVEAKFTESLYPGFWLGEKSCIRICHLKQDEPHMT